MVDTVQASVSTPLAPRKDWFVHDRFGLFIHWGIYSVAARHEWIKNRERISDADYQPFFDHFDPDLYDPAQWARDAKSAGMKYAVITTKHHDGFCLFDSKLTDYKAPNTPAGRDLIAEWVDAFRAEGLKIGFYHSVIDWHHPEFPIDWLHPQFEHELVGAPLVSADERDRHIDARVREVLRRLPDRAPLIEALSETNKYRDVAKYREYLHGQTRELLTNYGKIDIIWFDFSYPGFGGKGRNEWGSSDLVKMVRELQPGILINDRLDLPEEADFVTPEQYQPRGWAERNGKRVTWEACQTLNGSWGYDRDNHDWKSPESLVKLLVDTVSKGGNLLLNVGPTARGEFDPRARETLDAIGEWMRLHNRAIVGAQASELAAPPDCRFTRNGNRLYLHIFSWPFRHIHLDGMADQVVFAQFLNDGSEIKRIVNDPHSQTQNTSMSGSVGTVTLELPIQKPDVLVPVIEIFLKDAAE
ncbi:alpha-L-fucosidase [soil metagenome]